MMRIAALGMGLVVGPVVVLGLLVASQPDDLEITRSRIMPASPALAYDHADSVATWLRWSR